MHRAILEDMRRMGIQPIVPELMGNAEALKPFTGNVGGIGDAEEHRPECPDPDRPAVDEGPGEDERRHRHIGDQQGLPERGLRPFGARQFQQRSPPRLFLWKLHGLGAI